MHRKRLIKISTVQEKVGQKKTWIYARIKTGNFPKQVSIGPGAVAWIEDEIDDWIYARIAERDQQTQAA